MTDLPRQKLAELIARYGRDLSSDARRCEALLKDFCPQHKREIFVLVSAITASVTVELLNSSTALPKEVQLSRLTKRLNDSTGVAEDMARWAVESWALALGVASGKDFRFPFKCPGCDATGTMPTRFAGQTVNCPKCKIRLHISADGRNIAFDATASVPDEAAQTAASADTVFSQSSMTTIGAPVPEEHHDLFASLQDVSEEDVLRKAIRRVVANGIFSETERVELHKLRTKLGISPDVAGRILAEVKAEKGIARPHYAAIAGSQSQLSLPGAQAIPAAVPTENANPLHFLDDATAVSGGINPYSSPMTSMPANYPARAYRAHRGGLILTLGILGFALCGVAGIFALIMGNSDLKEMGAGRMDPSGQGLTRAGMILGGIACALMAAFVFLAVIGGHQ